VPDWRQLAHRNLQELEATGMRLLLDHTAQRIDPATRRVLITDPHGHKHAIGYDRLIVGTGAIPARPPILGLDLPGVHVLQHGRRLRPPAGHRGPPAAPGADRGRRLHRPGDG
jgi:NADPH-dependent 2,4-dienoyl-CoA reductase/sulfur reductase-like enzyme